MIKEDGIEMAGLVPAIFVTAGWRSFDRAFETLVTYGIRNHYRCARHNWLVHLEKLFSR